MIPIPSSELVLAQQNNAQIDLDSRLQNLIKAKASAELKSGYQLFYIGAHWCAPCKALKPLFESELKKYPKVLAYELNLTTDMDISDSQLVTALPAILLCQNGQVIQVSAGLLDNKGLSQMFSPLAQYEFAKDELAQGEFATGSSQAEAITTIKDYLVCKQLKNSQSYYQALPAEIRYAPKLQQVKSLIDLVETSQQVLLATSADDNKLNQALSQVLSHFVELEVEEGLELMAEQQIYCQAEYKSLYILAINTLSKREVAAHYRKKLVQS